METSVLIIVGLLLLIFGGEALVRGSVGVAKRLGVSELLIGLTLVGFGTSAPELVTSLQAAAIGSPTMAVGNVAGSNIANILLVLGLGALIRPIVTNPRALARDTVFLILTTILFIVLCYLNGFSQMGVGAAMVAALLAFLIGTVVVDQRRPGPVAEMHKAEGEVVELPMPFWLALVVAISGLAGIIYGAKLLIDNGIALARDIGVSETLIGLTIVAVGTSLPELVTVVVASMRGRADVAVGTIIGSNLFNILGILGITTLIHPFNLATDQFILQRDLGAVVLSLVFLILFALTGRKLARWEGFALLAGYGVYLYVLLG